MVCRERFVWRWRAGEGLRGMCCFTWKRRAAARKKVVGWRSAEARMTAAKKKYLYGAMGGMPWSYCVGWSALVG
jgi:hypothetical protein